MMMLDDKLAELAPRIEVGLHTYLASFDFGLSAELGRMLAYHMGWDGDDGVRGKRLRPALTLLCAGACGGDHAAAMPAALGIEFLHNFTLIHDDIEDRSDMRHGRPTLWTRWGLAQAVNAGDALFCIAQLAVLGLGETCSEAVAARAARELNQVCLQLTQGQYLDIAFEDADAVALETYLAMIAGKTAALISFCARMGGLTAGADEDTIAGLGDYGESLGLAFQIQDDTLGIWVDPAVTGKSAASDLLARKKSLPILYGLQECDEFKALWETEELSPSLVAEMAGLLVDCGAADYVKDKAAGFTQRAFDGLDRLFPNKNEDAAALAALTEKLLHREV